jgi:hypothetical protein
MTKQRGPILLYECQRQDKPLVFPMRFWIGGRDSIPSQGQIDYQGGKRCEALGGLYGGRWSYTTRVEPEVEYDHRRAREAAERPCRSTGPAEIVSPVATSQADVTVSEGVSGISGEDCPF